MKEKKHFDQACLYNSQSLNSYFQYSKSKSSEKPNTGEGITNLSLANQQK